MATGHLKLPAKQCRKKCDNEVLYGRYNAVCENVCAFIYTIVFVPWIEFEIEVDLIPEGRDTLYEISIYLESSVDDATYGRHAKTTTTMKAMVYPPIMTIMMRMIQREVGETARDDSRR